MDFVHYVHICCVNLTLWYNMEAAVFLCDEEFFITSNWQLNDILCVIWFNLIGFGDGFYQWIWE